MAPETREVLNVCIVLSNNNSRLKKQAWVGETIKDILNQSFLPSWGEVLLNGQFVPTTSPLTQKNLIDGWITIILHPQLAFNSFWEWNNWFKPKIDTEVNKLVAQVKELFEENQHLKDQLKIETGYNRILRQEIARYRKWRPGLAAGLFNTTVRIVSKFTGRPCK